VKDSILATYEAKTGLSHEELSQMMDDETWLTGTEAVEKGFADELLHSVEVVASLKGTQLIVNSVKHDLSAFKKKPIITEAEQDTHNSFKDMMTEFFNMFKNANQNTAVNDIKNKGKEEEEDLKTLEELKNKYPDLYNQAIQEGATVENARIKDIDEYTVPGYEDVMNEAKSDPTISAEAAVMKQNKAMKDAIKAKKENDQNKGQDYLKNRNNDAQDLNDIEGDSAPEGNEIEQKEIDDQAKVIANAINKNRGGAK
jgi:ATP-dependent Clp protease protease subunit